MHFLLIGHGGAKNRLMAIANELKKVPSTFVSCYFDDDLDFVSDKKQLPRADFLFIGLSRASREKNKAHDVEEDIVRRATALSPPMPCCVVCDEDGHISQPYLVTLGSKVQIVVAHARDPNCAVTDMCERAIPLYIPDVIEGAHQIAHTAHQLLRQKAQPAILGFGNPQALRA